MFKSSAIAIESLNTDREFDFTDEDFNDIAKRIYEMAGIVLQSHKKDMVYSRISRRLRALNFASFGQYRQYLASNSNNDENQHFVNALTTNLTSFFREPHHFEHMAKTVLPNLRQAGQPLKIRIWCSAASTGEEPYSIAATLAEFGVTPNDDVKVLATDLDTGVLERATAGVYPRKGLDKLPIAYKKYFRNHDDENVQVSPVLQQMLIFRQLNLLSTWPMRGPFDIIFCRNVLIYFDKPTCKAVVERMYQLLPQNGVLYLGHSEALPISPDSVINEGHTIYRKR